MKGISQQVFEGTLEGLNEVTLEKFIRRMCLKKENLETFLLKRPQRAVEELQEELRRIGEQVKSCAVPSFAWERAVIGKNDLILRRSTKEMHGPGRKWQSMIFLIIQKK